MATAVTGISSKDSQKVKTDVHLDITYFVHFAKDNSSGLPMVRQGLAVFVGFFIQ